MGPQRKTTIGSEIKSRGQPSGIRGAMSEVLWFWPLIGLSKMAGRPWGPTAASAEI